MRLLPNETAAFDVSSITLPTSGDYVGTWGSRLVADPNRPQVILSLPSGSSPVAWALVDIHSGAVTTANGLRGELRDALIEGSAAFCLTTHAICRLELGSHPAVTRCHRPRGLGTYLWRLLDCGPALLGATGWATNSLALFTRQTMELAKRIRIASPNASVRLNGNIVRLFSFHGGEAVDLDVANLRVVARQPLPSGTDPVLVGDEVYVLTGPRVRADAVIPVEKIWQIKPERLSVLDSRDYTVKRDATAPEGARHVLGVTEKTVVISTDTGICLAQATDLLMAGQVQLATRPIWQHVFVPVARAVVVLPDRFVPTELKVVTW